MKGEAKVFLNNRLITDPGFVIGLSGAKNDITEPNKNGKFIFRNLKPGLYNIRVISYFGTFDTAILLLNKSIKDLNFFAFPKCRYSKELALKDIENGTPKLICFGPVYTSLHDSIIKKYGIEFVYLEDPSADCYGCICEYNEEIIKNMKKKHINGENRMIEYLHRRIMIKTWR